MKKNILIAPVLKWVGGKRQLISDIEPLIPKKISTYVEPFVGGGAVLFHLQPKKAIINDFNKELMNVYQVIKDNPNELIKVLKEHKELNSEDYFYEIRSLDRRDDFENLSSVQKAGRIIYLNKTCYNGLFRVNRAGFFNTPYGKYKNPSIVNEVTIKASSSFTGYTEHGFDYEKQVELRDECLKLHDRGVKFLQSNSYSPEILELYSDQKVFNIEIVKAKRSINSQSDKRGEISEVLIYNYEKE